jgi:hypothetical protein
MHTAPPPLAPLHTCTLHHHLWAPSRPHLPPHTHTHMYACTHARTHAHARVDLPLHQVWGKPMSEGRMAVLMINQGDAPTQISVQFAALHIDNTSSFKVRCPSLSSNKASPAPRLDNTSSFKVWCSGHVSTGLLDRTPAVSPFSNRWQSSCLKLEDGIGSHTCRQFIQQ